MITKTNILKFKKFAGIENIIQSSIYKNKFCLRNKQFSYNTNLLKKLENDVFSKELSQWTRVGDISLTKRGSASNTHGKIYRINTNEGNNLCIFSGDNEALMYITFKESEKSKEKLGIKLHQIFKYDTANNYEGLGKVGDILTIKESIYKHNNGNFYLNTAKSDFHQNAEPLHWKRGFKRLEYYEKYTEKQRAIYDKLMENLFNKYTKARKLGKSIEESKKAMTDEIIPIKTMILPKEKIEEYKKLAERIKYY